METLMNSLNRLSDEELLTRLKALAREERDATARVIGEPSWSRDRESIAVAMNRGSGEDILVIQNVSAFLKES